MLASAALGQVLAASSSLLQEAHSSRDWPVFGPLCPAVSNFPAFPVPAILAIPNPEFVAHTVNSSIQVKHKKMLGGLLCERRHSEATPAMKPKLSLAVPIARPCSAANEGTHPGSVPLPLLLRMPHQDSAPIVLKQQPHEGVESEFEEEHSGHCMRIGCGKYEVGRGKITFLMVLLFHFL